MKTTYDAFISYDELTGTHGAEIIKTSLERKKISAFVAHIQRSRYSGNFETTIDKVIGEFKYFILLISIDALERPQVIREFKKAYPHNYLSDKPKLIIFHDIVAPRCTHDFVEKTGIDISKENQHDFKNQSELATRVLLLFIELLKPLLDNSISLVELVNKLQYLKPVLKDNSTQSLDLGMIFDRINQSYHTLHNNLLTFATLSFDSREHRSSAKDFIKRAKGEKRPTIEEELKEARVRCGDIENIYRQSLQEWFNQKNITDKDKDYIRDLFTETLNQDYIFVKEVKTATEFLQTSAEEISPMVDTGNLEQASAIIKKFNSELIPRLQKLGVALNDLLELKKAFMSVA
jgi:hypothetical protein